MLNIQYLRELFENLYIWAEAEILVLSNLIEIGVIFILLLLSLLLAKWTKKYLNWLFSYLKFISSGQKEKILEQLVKPITFMLLIWIYYLFSAGFQGPTFVSNIVGNLITAWIIIRLVLILLPKVSFNIRIIFKLIWIIAFLNIFGIYHQTISLLDQAILSLGELEISLLSILQGLLLLAVLIWLAQKSDIYLKKRIRKSRGMTPSIKVLLGKISKITLYAIAIILTMRSLGLDLTTFAFLGGAVALGIGFGLQKIVSNFFSGLIILADRSIKPGDVIEIDNVFGRIKSQESRFVSMVTRSGKEYLIPNENFITNQVINWSYSDKFVRVDIDVGVGYSSDLRLVEELLYKALEGKERVVKMPEPNVLLTEFANSSVNFKLRFWIDDPEKGVANLKSDILFSIWDLLDEHDINIPFPQRDLHLDSEFVSAIKKGKYTGQVKQSQEAAASREKEE